MFRKLWRTIQPVILWSYTRGSWQYDVIVVGILAFIFLTPRSFFNDHPRPPSVQEIETLGDEQGAVVFWIDGNTVEGTTSKEASNKLQTLLQRHTDQSLQVIAVHPITDTEGGVRAYLVYARP